MITNIADSKLAPIALFVFKRPCHTLQTLTSLAANPEFIRSPLFIYCDGARDESESSDVESTRNIVRNWNHPNKTIIEQEKNRGLANSVMAEVSELAKKFGRVIVVEDDLVVNEIFLDYLNSALERYKDIQQVMQISAYMFPVHEFADKKEALFLPFISSWGWATWDRAWRSFDAEASGWKLLLHSKVARNQFNLAESYDYSGMLLRQMNGEIDSWAIRWYWCVYRNNGLVLYPPTSLVKNMGFDGSGTHCRIDDFHKNYIPALSSHLKLPEEIEISRKDFLLIKSVLLVMSGSFFVRTLKRIRSNIKRIKMKMLDGFAGE